MTHLCFSTEFLATLTIKQCNPRYFEGNRQKLWVQNVMNQVLHNLIWGYVKTYLPNKLLTWSHALFCKLDRNHLAEVVRSKPGRRI